MPVAAVLGLDDLYLVGEKTKRRRTAVWEQDRSHPAFVKFAKLRENYIPYTFHDLTKLFSRTSHRIYDPWVVPKLFEH